MFPASGAVHVGRQPIFDRRGDVHGYELLFRGDAGAVEADERGAYATSRVLITAFTEIGIESLCGRGLCFVNLTREFLVGDLPLPFDHEQVVLEVLETVTIDDTVVAAVARLVEQGYRIALDDYVFGLGHEPLLELATYVKIDVLETPPDELVATVERCRKYPNLILVAERLETREQLEHTRALGFDLFQGYVLGRPQVVSGTALSPSRLARVELLGLLVGPGIPLNRVVGLVTSDPALSLRLMAAANADALGLPVKVSSVHEAVLLLGVDRLRDWATLMLVSDLDDPGAAQLSGAITRARMCQNIAERMEVPGEPAFTVGLISAVADLLGQRAAELATRLSLSHEVTDALVDGVGPLGELLSLVAAYEASDLPMLLAAPLPVEETALAYLDAVAYTGHIIAPRTRPTSP
ncbi:EAL and HDOD domain-containing protein [Dactylosporangium aurantiacum]|uniref:EAL and HDOD domain-containing protein n=1 Tax=Dactylosporangium aurantiacum TaxID=35754 RepID=UPI000693FCCC|nr:HDOD domain-containing protein [Dactylosporangium aurantiacum]MDG6103483.1 HDOD domain-containing protein [Dactylosporangium aurantiacum]